MRQRPKNIFASFLLALFGMQALFPLVLSVSVYFVRCAQWEFINENFAHVEVFKEIVLTESEYKAQDLAHENEIDVTGTLCDIHSVKKQNGRYLLLVLCDEKETGLKKVQASNEKKDRSNSLLVMLPVFCERQPAHNFIRSATPVKKEVPPSEFLSVNVEMIQSPPPDCKS